MAKKINIPHKNNHVEVTLFNTIRTLIDESRQRVAVSVNAELSGLYWQIGRDINAFILENQRAQYGKETIKTLSKQLTEMYGKGWSEQQLRHCIRTAEVFPDETIFSALRRELSWTHIKTIVYLDDETKRLFYIEMSKLENWSSRVLQERIKSMLFERTAISKKPQETIKQDLSQLKNQQTISADLVFRDPYLLDFLGLSDTYSEQDLESAILTELQRVLIELGSDFAFMARQKRISIDGRDYYIDLLFYHRRLRCLIAIDLKIGEFEAAYKGQMELYLNYLKKYEWIEGENKPIGLILCAGKNSEHIELMDLERSNIKVAQYLTVLPSQQVLQQKLLQAIALAKQKFS